MYVSLLISGTTLHIAYICCGGFLPVTYCKVVTLVFAKLWYHLSTYFPAILHSKLLPIWRMLYRQCRNQTVSVSVGLPCYGEHYCHKKGNNRHRTLIGTWYLANCIPGHWTMELMHKAQSSLIHMMWISTCSLSETSYQLSDDTIVVTVLHFRLLW